MPRSQHFSVGLSFSWSHTSTPPMPGSLSTARPTQGRAGRPRAAPHLPGHGRQPGERRRAPAERHRAAPQAAAPPAALPEEPSPRQAPSERPDRTARGCAAPASPRLPRDPPATAGPRPPATAGRRPSPPTTTPGSRPSPPRGTPAEQRRPRAGYSPPPSRPRPQKVSLPGPHRCLPLRRGKRQPRRPMAPRERAPLTNARWREAGPRGPPARLSGGSASRRAGAAPRLPPRPRRARSPGTRRCLRLLPAQGPGRASPLLPAGFSAAGAGPRLAAGA